jgi:hypothetical protein
MRELLQTRTRELPASALAGGFVVLGGVALWQLGIAFERAWMRSYDGPLLGEASVGERVDSPRRTQIDPVPSATGERRWIAAQGSRRAATAPPATRSRRR